MRSCRVPRARAGYRGTSEAPQAHCIEARTHEPQNVFFPASRRAAQSPAIKASFFFRLQRLICISAASASSRLGISWENTSSSGRRALVRSEEHTSELQSLMRISYAVFCLKKKNTKNTSPNYKQTYYT